MKNAALLHALVQNAIDGIITIDATGTIESINPSGCVLFDYTEAELVGKNISMLIPGSKNYIQDDSMLEQNETGIGTIRAMGKEHIGYTKNGYQFPFKLGVSEVNYGGKKIFAGFIHDLSQQKEDEVRLKNYASHLEELVEERSKTLRNTIKALQKSKEKLSASLEKEKELSNLKNRFLTMASHEFRTPLSTAQLSASLIEKYAEPFDSEPIKKHVIKIENAISNLTDILDDFLYMEQLETGKVTTKYRFFDLQELAKEIIEEMLMLHVKNQNILYSHKGITTVIYLDYNLLKNSLINLINNALKYSGEKSIITFTTEITDNQCIICVKDKGIGIPKKDQQHLFEPFFRAQNTANIPGTGIGLHIVKRYITLMEGTIDCSSNAKSGTTFTLKFTL